MHIDAEPYFRRPVHYTGQPQPIPALTPAQEQVFDGLKERCTHRTRRRRCSSA